MQDEGLEPRVAALEEQVRELRDRVRASEQDAAAARVLAGGADRDVGELGDELRDFRQATNTSFNALREDMLDMRQEMTGGFSDVATGFAEMRTKFDLTAAGQQHIAALIQQVIDRQGGAAPT